MPFGMKAPGAKADRVSPKRAATANCRPLASRGRTGFVSMSDEAHVRSRCAYPSSNRSGRKHKLKLQHLSHFQRLDLVRGLQQPDLSHHRLPLAGFDVGDVHLDGTAQVHQFLS